MFAYYLTTDAIKHCVIGNKPAWTLEKALLKTLLLAAFSSFGGGVSGQSPDCDLTSCQTSLTVGFTVNHPPLSLFCFFFFFSVTTSQHTRLTSNLLSNYLVPLTTHIGRQLYLPSAATQSLKMCIHEFYRSQVCGHHFPKLPNKPVKYYCVDNPCDAIYIPRSLTCDAVLLALKFYHDQVTYLPADMSWGTKVEIPRSCPVVHNLPEDTSAEVWDSTRKGHNKADAILRSAMKRNGLEPLQAGQIQREAEKADRCSNRASPGEHNPALLERHKLLEYPYNMYKHVQDVKAYQQRDRRHMKPNVRYTDVYVGCGGPFSAKCLIGWKDIELLTHRLHLWGDGTTHPRPCNDECLGGWSGNHLDAYRRQTWPGDTAIGWRDIVDYPTAAHNILVNRTRESQQPWTPLDFRNVSHDHTNQRKRHGPRSAKVSQLRTEKEPADFKVPECVWVPVPDRLHQILTNSPTARPEPVETPEMAEQRRREAWNRIREKIRRDHPAGERNPVVEEGQTTSRFVGKRDIKTDNSARL